MDDQNLEKLARNPTSKEGGKKLLKMIEEITKTETSTSFNKNVPFPEADTTTKIMSAEKASLNQILSTSPNASFST